MAHVENIGGKDYLIGEPHVVVEDLDKRVAIFIDQVILEQCLKRQEAHAVYIAKIAKYLTYILIANDREDLVDTLSNAILDHVEVEGTGLDLVVREIEMFRQYIRIMLEKGYLPQNPYEPTPLK